MGDKTQPQRSSETSAVTPHATAQGSCPHDLPDRVACAFQQIFNQAGEAIIVLQGPKVRFANTKAENLFGFPLHHVAGQALLEAVHPDDRSLFQHPEQIAANDSTPPSRWMVRIRRRAGDDRWLRFHRKQIQWEREPAIVYYLTDITERKSTEEELQRSESQYRGVIEATSEGFMMMNAQRRITQVNTALLDILGYTPEEIIGRLPEELYDRNTIDVLYASKDHLSFEVKFLTKAGQLLQVLFKRSTLKGPQGNIIGYIAFLSDLTELKYTQEQVKAAEKKYRSMYENAVQGMFQSTLSGKLLSANPAYADILGYGSPMEIIGRSDIYERFYFHPSDHQKLLTELQKRSFLTNYEMKLKRSDGSPVWVLVNVRLEAPEGGEPFIEGIMVDNTAIKLAEEELRRSEQTFRELAIHDNLTGLYNTRYLYSTLSDLIDQSRQRHTPFSLIFMDIDNFKQVVDTHGHLNGSQALQEVAQSIRETLSEPAFGVAYGGDEFVVVLPDCNKRQAQAHAEIIRKQMIETVYLSEQGLKVSLRASFGLACFPEDADDRVGLLALADKAMFGIKKRGKNGIGTHSSLGS